MPINIYVAGPWAHKPDLKIVADKLREEGFRVTSRWHDTTLNSNIYEAESHVMSEEAQKDFNDILDANTIVYLNLKKSEGKATELGIALALNYNIYVIGGKVNNVFLHLPQVNHRDSLFEVLGDLNASRSNQAV